MWFSPGLTHGTNGLSSVSPFKRFFAEKALEQQVYEVTAPGGTTNLLMTSDVIYALLNASDETQAKAAEIIRQLDFNNADIHHFLRHMAKGMAFDLGDL